MFSAHAKIRLITEVYSYLIANAAGVPTVNETSESTVEIKRFIDSLYIVHLHKFRLCFCNQLQMY
jgi:hypothetical protein